MFASVLIANRGEIAVRVARTAKRLGMRTIAVYSEADAGALHVRCCDEAILIGAAPPRESYLAIDRLIAAAQASGAECVHPGYGFVSEKAEFAEACVAAGTVFVGPPPAAIRAMGLKDRAKALMEKSGVPVVPGYHGEQQGAAFLKRKAYEIGYPVLIKAVAGGGGRGMRRVDKHAEFEEALAAAQRESEGAFGDARVLIEKYVEAPRHIEIQVLADREGRTIHLNERDCSLQRRHQKVIEEAPAPGMTPELRVEIGRAAVMAALAVGYVGAGTVEFIADSSSGLRSGGYWFMEMNTRLQVEHPVTEATTGLDLVECQFQIAAGEPLLLAQSEVPLSGHAIEARIYAEDPDRGFLPSPGRIAVLEWPAGAGIRVDAGYAAGDLVPPDYDSLIAKLIARGPDRETALGRLAAALADTIIVGPHVNTPFLHALIEHPRFHQGRFDTAFIERHLATLLATDPDEEARAAAQGVAALLDRERRRIAEKVVGPAAAWQDPWSADDGFSLGPPRSLALDVQVNGAAKRAEVTWGAGSMRVAVDGVEYECRTGIDASDASTAGRVPRRVVNFADGVVIFAGGRQYHVTLGSAASRDVGAAGGASVLAPMNGKIVAVLVEPGQRVAQGARVAIMEAMKMEHTLTAAVAGVVAETVAAGAQVLEGTAVVRIEPDTKS